MRRDSVSPSFVRPSRIRTARVIVPLAALAVFSPAAFADPGDWVEFFEETNARLVAATSVGTADVEEKDYAIGDVDNDGDPDIVSLRKTPFSNAGGKRDVLFMNENGVMTDRTSTLAPDLLDITDDRDGQLADLNNDGWLDLVTSGAFGQASRVLINLGEVGGVWQGFDHQPARLPVFSPTPNFCSVAVGDVTGDGFADLYFTDYDTNVEDRLLINDGTGNFTDQTSARLTFAMVNSTFALDSQIADMNGDGFNDIVKDNASGSGAGPGGGPDPNVSVMYNDGTGHFTFRDEIYSVEPYSTEVADFTKDGKLDLFIVDDAQDRFMINQGNNGNGRATFQTTQLTQSPHTNFFGGTARFADLDDDGILDVLVADVDTDIPGCDRRLAALRGTGTPPAISFRDPLGVNNRPWLKFGVYDVAPLDINGDGALDLFIGTCSGTHVFMGAPTTFFRDGFESGDTSAWSQTVN